MAVKFSWWTWVRQFTLGFFLHSKKKEGFQDRWYMFSHADTQQTVQKHWSFGALTPAMKNHPMSYCFFTLYILLTSVFSDMEVSDCNKSKLSVCRNECWNTYSPVMPPMAICFWGDELDRSRISSLTHWGGCCTATSSPPSLSPSEPDINSYHGCRSLNSGWQTPMHRSALYEHACHAR